MTEASRRHRGSFYLFMYLVICLFILLIFSLDPDDQLRISTMVLSE